MSENEDKDQIARDLVWMWAEAEGIVEERPTEAGGTEKVMVIDRNRLLDALRATKEQVKKPN